MPATPRSIWPKACSSRNTQIRVSNAMSWCLPEEPDPHRLGSLCQYFITCSAQKFFWWLQNTLCSSLYPLPPILILLTPEKNLALLHSLCTAPSGIGEYWQELLWTCSSSGWAVPFLSDITHWRGASIRWWLCWTPSCMSMSFLYRRTQNWRKHSRWSLTNGK